MAQQRVCLLMADAGLSHGPTCHAVQYGCHQCLARQRVRCRGSSACMRAFAHHQA